MQQLGFAGLILEEIFFSEAVGIFITVSVVDRLINWSSETKLKPARLAAFRDAMEISHVAREFVSSLARSSLPISELDRVKRETSITPPTGCAGI